MLSWNGLSAEEEEEEAGTTLIRSTIPRNGKGIKYVSTCQDTHKPENETIPGKYNSLVIRFFATKRTKPLYLTFVYNLYIH